MLGCIMTIITALSIFAVSYENEFWNFWGEEQASRRNRSSPPSNRMEPASNAVKGFAHAIPVGNPLSDEYTEYEDLDEEDDDGSESAQQTKEEKRTVEESSDSASAGDVQTNKELKTSEPVSPAPDPVNVFLTDTEEQGQSNTFRNSGKTASTTEADSPTQKNSGLANGGPKEVPAKTFGLDQNDLAAVKENENSEENKPQHHYKSQRRTRAKTFLVVFMGHSGSTAFTTELRTHNEFEVELLEPLDHGEYEGNTELALKKARELMDRGIAKGKIPGFKIRPFHINNMPERWQEFVKEYDARVFWQYRENIVKQAIGEYRHRFLNDSSVVEGLDVNEKPCAQGSDQKCRIKIENMRGLHSLMDDFSSSDELLASAARNLRRDNDISILRYEDYLYCREQTMREAFDFLGVEYQNTAPQRQKASPDNLCEMVSNFQEVCDHFLPCQLWRPYMHDAVNNCRCKPGGWKTFDSTYCRRAAWFQSKD